MNPLDITQEEDRDDARVVRGFIELVRRTNTASPAPEDVRALREMMAAHAELWRVAGDLAQRTTLHLIEQASASAAVRESLARGAVELRAGLGFERAPALEKVVIEQVVLCWVRLNLFEQRLAAVLEEGTTAETVHFWEERVANGQRQLLRACESLARIRKLAQRSPDVTARVLSGVTQINIGREGAIGWHGT